VADLLASQGFRAVSAASSYQALQILAAEHIDVLLTDIVMPGKTGVELAIEARRLNPALKVLFLTGYVQRSTEQAAMRLGKAIFKPVRAPDIVREVKALLPPSDQSMSV
jgi:CheY-like chemotaxis protein